MIRHQVDDGVGRLTLERADAHNAISAHDLRELGSRFHELDRDPRVAVIVITGFGERAFSAGADISEFGSQFDREHAMHSEMQSAFDDIATSRTTTIAAVNGFAIGGGFELALACDLRVASHSASFALPELGLGLLPAAGGAQRLTRLVGPGRTMDLILTGRRISADQALEWGIVTEVVVPERLDERATELATVIAAKGPIAVATARLLVKNAGEMSLRAGLAMEGLAQAVAYASEDVREGAAAFVEKRAPRFQGK